MPYNQMYQQQNPYIRMNQPYYTPQNNGINWVQGVEGAKAWQLAPNSNAVLLDSEIEDRFYIKTSDNIGMCTLRMFNYFEVTDQPQSNTNVDLSEYVKKSELQSLIASMIGGQNEQPLPVSDGTKRSLISK